jgi:voltage-gated potassium channel
VINNAPEKDGWRKRWYTIIFESDTPFGKQFDVGLLIAILSSLVVVMLETVKPFATQHRPIFITLEWIFTAIFTAEYLLRLAIVKKPAKYAFSFYGLVDLISIIPSYLALVIGGAQYFIIIRSLRLLRVFRVLKMVRFLGEAQVLNQALRSSRPKIIVFIIAVTCMTFILGAVMFMIEGPENGFTSIPVAVYWCIVTLTTVGYGDISPQTPLGQVVASIIMILGYGIIAVPTGIVTSEISKQSAQPKGNQTCPSCGKPGLSNNAQYCENCGEALP